MFGRKLQFYAVYRNPEEKEVSERYRFVADKFSFLAFVLPVVWALMHRMWLLSVLIVGFYAVGGYYLGEDPLFMILQTGVHLLIALSAADLEGFKLRARGWQFEGVVAAESLEQSRQRYFDHAQAAL